MPFLASPAYPSALLDLFVSKDIWQLSHMWSSFQCSGQCLSWGSPGLFIRLAEICATAYYEDVDIVVTTGAGSSVATALAAGTAAVVLTCARITAIESLGDKRGVSDKVLKEMQKRDNMAAALDRLGGKLGENKFIEVWQMLDTRNWSDFRDKRPAGKMEMVATKVMPLLPI